VPGFVAPVRYQGHIWGDGGVSCNLPAFAARALGADYVIGVDLVQPKLRRRGGPFRYGLAALEMMVERSGGGPDAVDCLITPPLAGMSYIDVNQLDDLVARGRHAAEAQLSRVRAALNGP
jgi:NTE family protein